MRIWDFEAIWDANHAIMFSIKLVKDALRGFQRGWGWGRRAARMVHLHRGGWFWVWACVQSCFRRPHEQFKIDCTIKLNRLSRQAIWPIFSSEFSTLVSPAASHLLKGRIFRILWISLLTHYSNTRGHLDSWQLRKKRKQWTSWFWWRPRLRAVSWSIRDTPTFFSFSYIFNPGDSNLKTFKSRTRTEK